MTPVEEQQLRSLIYRDIKFKPHANGNGIAKQKTTADH